MNLQPSVLEGTSTDIRRNKRRNSEPTPPPPLLRPRRQSSRLSSISSCFSSSNISSSDDDDVLIMKRKSKKSKSNHQSRLSPPAPFGAITPRIKLILEHQVPIATISKSGARPLMALPRTLNGYLGEGYEEAKRIYQQREPNNFKEWTDSVEWLDSAIGEILTDDSKKSKTFYQKALVDGDLIEPGTYILVREDDNEDNDENEFNNESEAEDEENVKKHYRRRSARLRRMRRDQNRPQKGGSTGRVTNTNNTGNDHTVEVLLKAQETLDINQHSSTNHDMGSKDFIIDLNENTDKVEDMSNNFGRTPVGNIDENEILGTNEGRCIDSNTEEKETLVDSEDKEDKDGYEVDADRTEHIHESEDKRTWFAKVIYLYEQNGVKMAHIRYFSQGWQTLLMEQSTWQELFLLDNCDEIILEAIMGTFQLRMIRAISELKAEDTYFCRYWYDPQYCVFEGAAEHEIEVSQAIRKLDHCDLPTAPTPFDIGQIIELHHNSNGIITDVSLRRFLRHDDFLDKNPPIKGTHNRRQKSIFTDSRRLVLTDIIVKVPLNYLEETCQVRFIPEITEIVTESGSHQPCLWSEGENAKDLANYKNQPDCYWFRDYLVPKQEEKSNSNTLSDQDVLEALRERLCHIYDNDMVKFDGRTVNLKLPGQCLVCKEQRVLKQNMKDRLIRTSPKLCAMDLFSGCGGLTLGLDASGMVETKFAVEIDKDAASSFRHNFPSVSVLNEDAGHVLERAIAQTKDKINRQVTNIPASDEVDFIYGGPPCQGFSRISGSANPKDPKNGLVATTMAFVDIYRPRYVLIENVKGFTEMGDSQSVHKKPFVKFVVRCLTDLGYQCRIGMLQAGHFGVPQSRYRFFVWAAKLGCTLPTFPLPTTAFKFDRNIQIDPPLNLMYNGHQAFDYLGSRGIQAPDPMVTVRNAISDLPGFEYVHPDESKMSSHQLDMLGRGHYMLVNPSGSKIFKIGFAECEKEMSLKLSTKDQSLLKNITEYQTEPQCEFQRKLRSWDSTENPIRNHSTELVQSSTVRSIFNVSMVPDGRADNSKKGSRLDYEGFFGTITNSADAVNYAKLIHPNQHRVTTIRERARAQGFPDSFAFPAQQKPSTWRKQVGNAVPPPLAAELGRMLVEAMTQDSNNIQGVDLL
ncbi:hypothetical protein FBU30_008428 [Linnemannia zychae]|nr:hypothetical protein FBU30_008428 [Linnemannia zychae]